MEAAGAGAADPVRITDHRADDREPAWSPDGTQIAFASTRHKGSEIYVMRADGRRVKRLTNDKANNEGPAWSPAGFPGEERIAYMAEEAHYRSALIAVAPDGSRSQRLTSGGSYHDFDPAYSPDGSRITFASEKPGHLQFEIFVMPATTGWDTEYREATQLTDLEGMTWAPDWSPDGTRIAFAAKTGDQWGIYVMDADGSNVTPLVKGPDRYDAPAWSPVPGATE
jgi:Tol biopolymer transport system component